MEIIIIIILILINGAFSMSEIAIVSSRRFKLEGLIKRGNKNAKLALELSNNPNKFLSTVQMGMTLIGILTGIFGGKQITEDLALFLQTVPFIAVYSHSIAVLIIILIITFLSIVFGELIPKRIGLMYPESIAVKVARPMYVLSLITKPFVWLLTKTNDSIMNMFGISGSDSKITEEEIKAIVQNSLDDGEIQQIEHHIVDRVFAMGDRSVSEIMTHRTDIKFFDIKDDITSIKNTAREETHSIYPVVDTNLDNIRGILNLKQAILSDDFDITKFIIEPIYVPDTTPVYMVLEKFRENKIHLAIVVDEYGGVQGLLTMDDVLDALVGDITQRHHLEYEINQRDENSWLVDAQYSYYEMLHYFGIPEEESTGEYNTIAGLILDTLGSIPKSGDKIVWNKFTIEVIDMDGVRIDRLLITKNNL